MREDAKILQPLAATLKYLILVAGAFIMVFPFIWMIIASLMTAGEIQLRPPVWLPAEPQFQNYTALPQKLPIARLYFNSLFTSALIVFGVLLSSSLAGFAFAKYRFPGRELLFYLILATMMIPFFVTLIPVFFIVRQLGWIDTYQGLVVPGLTSAYGIFLMRQFIITLPDELIDAARIDGASEPRIFWRIIVPLVQPALATLGAFAFIGAWNNFLWPPARAQQPRPDDAAARHQLDAQPLRRQHQPADGWRRRLRDSNADRLHFLAALLHPGHRADRLERIKPHADTTLSRQRRKRLARCLA